MISTASHPLRPDSPPLDTPSPAPYSSTPLIPPTNGERTEAETGYFDGVESTQHDDEPDDSDRPQLKSRSTIRATPLPNLSSPDPVTTESPTLPRSLTFPRPPHLLPSATLAQLPTPLLIALVVALSRDLTDSNQIGDRSSRVNKALEELLSGKGMSEGELERITLRAGVAVELPAAPPADWQIELSVEDGAEESVREVKEINQRRSRKSIVARDQTEVESQFLVDLSDFSDSLIRRSWIWMIWPKPFRRTHSRSPLLAILANRHQYSPIPTRSRNCRCSRPLPTKRAGQRLQLRNPQLSHQSRTATSIHPLDIGILPFLRDCSVASASPLRRLPSRQSYHRYRHDRSQALPVTRGRAASRAPPAPSRSQRLARAVGRKDRANRDLRRAGLGGRVGQEDRRRRMRKVLYQSSLECQRRKTEIRR